MCQNCQSITAEYIKSVDDELQIMANESLEGEQIASIFINIRSDKKAIKKVTANMNSKHRDQYKELLSALMGMTAALSEAGVIANIVTTEELKEITDKNFPI